MTVDHEFRAKLDAVARKVAAPGRAQTEALIASVVKAGGTTEAALLDMLKNGSLDPVLRGDLAWLVPRLDIAAAGRVLEELMSDPSEQVRVEAATALGLTSDDEAVEVLLNALETDASTAVRQAAIHALGVRSVPGSVAGVTRVLGDLAEDAELRADAAEALAHVRDERIVPVLIETLQDTSPAVRYSAAYALGEQGDARALRPLRRLAAHDHATTAWGTVASQARRSVAAIADQEA